MEKRHTEHPDKELVASCFKASATTYDGNAVVQRGISRNLVKLLSQFTNIGYSRVLEIGCCTGILTEMLCESAAINTLFVNDLVPDYCLHTRERILRRVKAVQLYPGDIEKVVLPHDLDLVVSSSTLQWIADLPNLIYNIAAALHRNGHLAFSIFSPGTMGEISTLTGRGLHYHTGEELAAILAKDFNVLSVHEEKMQLVFPSLQKVLQHIRQTGVGGLGKVRWNLRELRDFERRYTAQYATEEGLPVTYNSIFVVAEKRKERIR
ncbi:MAG: malonyl-ACP O-methyltransferase BioC [Desulforhopalus sp.]|nr:malonyl-ACP O-methyltransferase BioC [Desulforhopalus sp.]